jgi:phosphate transport system protein
MACLPGGWPIKFFAIMDLATARHTLGDFDDALRSLRDSVLMMASLTDRIISAAAEGLFSRNFEACERVIADDSEIDSLEKSVDESGVAILVRFQPLANDLREVVAAMKVSGNLERVADQAVSIARRARRLNESSALPETAGLREMFDQCTGIFRDGIRSFADRNEVLARGLKERDRQLDALQHRVIDGLTTRMAADTPRIRDYLDLVLVARNIERIGDHATNIAEDAVFAASAEDIRHTAPPAA